MPTQRYFTFPKNTKWIYTDDCGFPHRLFGPALETTDGIIMYFLCGLKHRKDGPAVIYPNGDTEYWINGKLQKKIIK
jgi:hypothetical protein